MVIKRSFRRTSKRITDFTQSQTSRELRDDVFSLLDDPDPGVRVGAAIAARKFTGWEAALLPRMEDLDAAVARRARLELSHSEEPSYARPALLQLVRDREAAALHRQHEGVADEQLADAMLDWVDSAWDTVIWEMGPHLERAYSRDILVGRVDRILALYDRAVRQELESTLIEVLVKLDDPRADEVLVEKLRDHRSIDPMHRIVSALLVRRTPLRSTQAVQVLIELLEEHEPCYHRCNEDMVVLLLRLGRDEGLGWFLRNLELEEGELLPVTQVLGWISGGSEENSTVDREAELRQRGRHAGWGE